MLMSYTSDWSFSFILYNKYNKKDSIQNACEIQPITKYILKQRARTTQFFEVVSANMTA